MSFHWKGGDGREPEQEDILALALILAQSYGPSYPGMAAEDWLAEARHQRAMVKAAGDVFYSDEVTP